MRRPASSRGSTPGVPPGDVGSRGRCANYGTRIRVRLGTRTRLPRWDRINGSGEGKTEGNGPVPDSRGRDVLAEVSYRGFGSRIWIRLRIRTNSVGSVAKPSWHDGAALRQVRSYLDSVASLVAEVPLERRALFQEAVVYRFQARLGGRWPEPAHE